MWVKFSEFLIRFVCFADTFGQYDYGRAMNLRYYNSTEPPTYDLKSIQVPITLIYGENDILADTTVSFDIILFFHVTHLSQAFRSLY